MKYLLGPETIWILIYFSTRILTKTHILPNKLLDTIILNCWYWVPLMTILLFALYWTPFSSHQWLLARIWIVSLVFGHLTLEHLTSSYVQQGPGIGTTYIARMLLLFVGLVAGSILISVLKMNPKM